MTCSICDVGLARVLADREDRDDARMRQAPCGARLANQPLAQEHAVFFGNQRVDADDFDGHQVVDDRVVAATHHAHAAAAER